MSLFVRFGLSIFPFHSESERSWFAWLGLYVATWSSTEGTVERLIDFIYDYQDGASVEREKPLNLDRRIKFIKRAAVRLAQLASEKDELLSMMDALSECASFRHLVVHGTNKNFYKTDPHWAYLS